VDGVRYFTAPALCEKDSYTFTVVEIQEQKDRITVEPKNYSLYLDEYHVADMHCHTEFAYCAKDVAARTSIERGREFGLAGMGFAEHSAHLYVSREEYGAKQHILNPEVWKAAKNGRMDQYRRTAEALRSDFVKFGFEIELDIDGQPILHEDDRAWAEYLLGAVHLIPGVDATDSPAVQNRRFLSECETLLACDVDTLAHPFRWFVRNRQPPPRELFEPLAHMLLETGTAAEINFHTNKPPREFFELCRDIGVDIVYGSDAHNLYEVGNLLANLQLLRPVP
jgi:histidinol phosphatase-like PHP family hydrolase